MKINKQKLLGIVIVVLIIALPIAIYLARNAQLLRREAAFGQITLNVVPTEISKNIGEPFTVEIHANSGDKPVSAIKVTLAAPRHELIVQEITGAIAANEAFTDLIYDKNIDPFSFTLVSRKPTSTLPQGSFKVASITLFPFEGGTQTLGINASLSEAVGYNGTSEDVVLSVVAGTSISYTISGSLCRIAQCVLPASIAVSPQLRPDNKFNVALSFTSSSDSAKLFKIYRNTGATVPAEHPIANLAGITSPLVASGSAYLFVDNNDGIGHPGEANLHYDIDGYDFCALPTSTVTPQITGTATPTVTPTGGAQ